MTFAIARVLLCSPNPAFSKGLGERLTSRNWTVIESGMGAEVLRLARDENPDLAIAVSPNGADGGVAVAESIKQTAECAHIPVVVLAANGGKEIHRACLAAGVDDLMPIDVDDRILLPRLQPLVRLATLHSEMCHRIETARSFDVLIENRPNGALDVGAPRVLVVGAPGDPRDRIVASLVEDAAVTFADDTFAANDALLGGEFDAVVLNPGGDSESYPHLCGHIRNNPRLFNLPVLALVGKAESPNAVALYRGGASIVLDMPPEPATLRATMIRLVKRQRLRRHIQTVLAATRASATTRPETGLYTREFGASHLNRLIEIAAARYRPLSAAMFKIQNTAWAERYFGAGAGDRMMRQVADWIAGLIRAEDLAIQWNHDEILVVLPDTTLEEAKAVSNRIAGVLLNTDFSLQDTPVCDAVRVWLECGTTRREPGDSVGTLIDRIRENLA